MAGVGEQREDVTEPLEVDSGWTPEQVRSFYEAGHWRADGPVPFLDAWVQASPDQTFVIEGDVHLSRREVFERSRAVACSLHDRGVRRGERVAVQLPNWHEFIVIQLAVLRLGAVLVPIMPVYRDREVAHVLATTDAVAFVYTPRFRGFDYRSMAARLAVDLAHLATRVVVRAEGGPADGEVGFEQLLEAGDRADLSLEPAAVDDPHFIVFTSGTESKSKGCLHTWNTYAFTPRAQLPLYAFDATSTELVVSPITHTTGLASGLIRPFLGGGRLCLMDVWDADAVVELIDRYGCTHTTGATPFLTMLLDAVERRGRARRPSGCSCAAARPCRPSSSAGRRRSCRAARC